MRLAREGFAGVLIIASVTLGLSGASVLVGSVSMIGTPMPYPFALATVGAGVVVFAVGIGLMARARHLSEHHILSGNYRPMSKTVRRLLVIIASVVLVSYGVALLLFPIVAHFGHGVESSTIVQVAAVAGGVVLIAVGVGAMRAVRRLHRR